MNADRFRDAALVGAELVHLLEGTDFREECVEAAGIYGKALRMTGKRAESIDVLQRALEQGEEFLGNETKASLLLAVALAHETEGKRADAAEAARQVIELSRKDLPQALQAQGIIVSATKSGYEREKELSALEQLARSRKYFTVANNFALELANISSNIDESLRLQERVLKGRGDPYNRARAIIDKSELLVQKDRVNELSFNDRRLLSSAYSYSYAQRMSSLFEPCHHVLWSVLSVEKLWAPLVRLFRHSSFLLRIKGSDETEQTYLHKLDALDIGALKRSEGSSLALELDYLDRRRHAVDETG